MARKYMLNVQHSWLQKRCKSKQYLDFISPQLEWPESRVIATNAGKDVRNRNPYTLLVRLQISTTTMESSMEIPQKTKDRTAI
jgi:hypothetical protein